MPISYYIFYVHDFICIINIHRTKIYYLKSKGYSILISSEATENTSVNRRLHYLNESQRCDI
jgi:hypothetical protein